ncbi:unnamed protein product [Paramecium sonneborni]|uniref:Uncharacterized protein n=1 Tax=Paramecium sonneborni TaxID=65129 RepID=A0A8S1LS14_9CILI|nr:unnamed protein product [Paramecium sonneborni]
MNLNNKHERFSSDDSVDMSDYKIESSKKQSTIKYSNSKSSSSDESLTDMIKKKRQQINKKVYGKEEQQQLELDDATFDLSDTYNDSNKFKNGNESTLESRIKKLEQELNTSVKSTLQRNYQHNQSASMTSVDSFSIDFKQFQQQSDLKVNYYNNRLESLRSKNQEPAIEWKKTRKIEEFDFEISNLQQELEQLKDSLNKEEKEQNKQKIKLKHQLKQYTQSNSDEDEQEYKERVYDLPMQQNQQKTKKVAQSSKKSSHHSAASEQNQNQIQNTNFKKKSRTDIEVIDEMSEQNSKDQHKEVNFDDSDKLSENENQEIPKQNHKKQASKKQSSLQNLPISTIEFKEKDGNDVSIDVVPQKHQTNNQMPQILTENQFPNTLILPSKTSLQCDVSRLYKLNKEVEVLQQIEKIRDKLKKSINKKMNSEKVVERYDPSFTMSSKTKIMNKSGKLHCPNCTYLLNKGMSTAYCHCNK